MRSLSSSSAGCSQIRSTIYSGVGSLAAVPAARRVHGGGSRWLLRCRETCTRFAAVLRLPFVFTCVILSSAERLLHGNVQVELGAIHDLLFSQCDRHPQNVIINADGSLKLIDNDQAFLSSWRR